MSYDDIDDQVYADWEFGRRAEQMKWRLWPQASASTEANQGQQEDPPPKP